MMTVLALHVPCLQRLLCLGRNRLYQIILWKTVSHFTKNFVQTSTYCGSGESDIASSAGICEGISLESENEFSKNENWQQHCKGSKSRRVKNLTGKWLRDVNMNSLGLDIPPVPTVRFRAASPAESDFSDRSSAAIDPHRCQEILAMEPIAEGVEDDPEPALRWNDARYFSELGDHHNILSPLPS